MATQEEDDKIVEQLQQGEHKEEAFSKLVALYKERLYWHIRHIVKNHEDANDVLQNTFIKIFRYIKNFKGNSKLYSWMYRIATNESITFINKKAKQLQLSSQEMQDYLVDNLESDVYFEGDKIQLALHKALATLPEKQRQVFNMKYFQDLKYKEIAEILEVSEGACKSNYHHASKKIEEYLKQG
ncbi:MULTISPECIES: RNA polymerase sigma factor [Mesonia]|uniref:ECF RNA polymerase sigma-E factor n=1 Tax=Mesonia oceanica TaxID=2687242 RepID=A0AC61Y6U0_9FLAO|nr:MULTISPECIES: RNA polymerase sigma factor [Mesonia]MAN28869.1 RNA polymerase subunit sigma-70 [Mesonia sp.]MAQ40384.1 RNA polymerase subunit sigma-70 [Mesonia sp.]MBJ98005.1 RNA polymerase subunit sigma-70 [Flavobacteriaceae bacterium]VVV00221.1 ECF RNA polymerase sigma-E factor [Mesonia oceanica]|tara:strand:+ start:40057 stop:40608 length:552 start_codon:yes stop_codon:yes gene_type:complete